MVNFQQSGRYAGDPQKSGSLDMGMEMLTWVWINAKIVGPTSLVSFGTTMKGKSAIVRSANSHLSTACRLGVKDHFRPSHRLAVIKLSSPTRSLFPTC